MIVWRALESGVERIYFSDQIFAAGPRSNFNISRHTRSRARCALWRGFFYLKNLVAIVYSGTVYGVAPDERANGRTGGRPLFLLFVYELFLLRPGILNLRCAFPYDEDFVVPDLPTDTFERNFLDIARWCRWSLVITQCVLLVYANRFRLISVVYMSSSCIKVAGKDLLINGIIINTVVRSGCT